MNFHNLLFRINERLKNIINTQKNDYYKREYGFNNVFIANNARINIENKDLSNISVGQNVQIYGDINIFKSGSFKIGKNSFVGEFSKIFVFSNIEIGDNCLISHGVTVMDSDTHSKDFQERADEYYNNVVKGIQRDPNNMVVANPTKIGNDVWIGCNSIILKGVTIGDRAIIGAGSIINTDIPCDSVVTNNIVLNIKELYNGSDK